MKRALKFLLFLMMGLLPMLAASSGSDSAFDFATRGYEKHVKGDLDGAIADYTKAIQLNPNYAEAYAARSVAEKVKGDSNGANADHAKAIQLKPGISP